MFLLTELYETENNDQSKGESEITPINKISQTYTSEK